jgi:hypothetical protein
MKSGDSKLPDANLDPLFPQFEFWKLTNNTLDKKDERF